MSRRRRNPKHMDHAAYQERLRGLSEHALRYSMKDAHEAMRIMPSGENAGYYADEVNYIGMELARRKRNPASRRRGTYYVHDRYLGDFLDFPSLHSAARFADVRFGCKPAAECVFVKNKQQLVPIGSLRMNRNPKRKKPSRRLSLDELREHEARQLAHPRKMHELYQEMIRKLHSPRRGRNPLPNEHSARIIDPKNVVEGSYRRENKKGGTIGMLFAKVRGARPGPRGGVMQLASVHFRAAHFTPSQAKEWMRSHGFRYILFEAATNSRKAAWASEAPRAKRADRRDEKNEDRWERWQQARREGRDWRSA